jgi:hypothetical protein
MTKFTQSKINELFYNFLSGVDQYDKLKYLPIQYVPQVYFKFFFDKKQDIIDNKISVKQLIENFKKQNYKNYVESPKPIKQEVKQDKKLNNTVKNDLQFADQAEYKNYYRTFKKGVKRPNGTISNSVRKFFNKKAKELIDNNISIEELIQMYQQRYRKNRSFVHGYLYVEAKKDKSKKYAEDYNYSNPHIIQWDSKREKKYSFCLEINLILKDNLIN